MPKKEIYLILHNIRSLHNVGSIFRTADCAGVEKIFLTGYTPAPVDIFGKVKKEIAKTALGAEKTVPWKKYKNISNLIAKLTKDGPLESLENSKGPSLEFIGVEQSTKAVNYKKFSLDSARDKKPLALIFGNEVRGLSKQILNKCDEIIEIPMQGRKESLNVTVACGVVLFHLID